MTDEERLKLDRRIHNQRVNLRRTWQEFEARADFVGGWYVRRKPLHSKLLEIAIRQRQENIALKVRIAELEAHNSIAHN